MSHVRQQIREAAISTLTGLSTTASRVHASRLRPREAAALPCLLVQTNDESIGAGSVGTLQERELQLVVRGLARAADNLDDTLDTIALEIETALAAAPTLGGKAKSLELRRVQVDFNDDLEMPVGAIALEYAVTYFINAGSPGSAL